MYSTSDFRNGLKILLDGLPYEIVYFQHVKPGKGGAFVRTKIRNLLNSAVVEKTFRSSEKVGKPEVEDIEMQYLYNDGDYHFMNNQTYEQISVSETAIGSVKNFLKENTNVRVLIFNGQVVSIDLPAFMVLEVADCEPAVRGDTVSGATKSATLETGAIVQVPLFVSQGERIKVDTRSGEYIERSQG